jgi:hypothetical protein
MRAAGRHEHLTLWRRHEKTICVLNCLETWAKFSCANVWLCSKALAEAARTGGLQWTISDMIFSDGHVSHVPF